MNPPKIILVATDFSEPARAALDYAVTLGSKLGAAVHLLHTFEIPLVGFPDGVLTVTAQMASTIIDGAQTALRREAERYASRGVVIETILEQSEAREGVIAVALRLGADLVVMGTHGRRGISRALIGSVTEAVVRTSPVPVLTVHADKAPSA